jgi:hypothetical protein
MERLSIMVETCRVVQQHSPADMMGQGEQDALLPAPSLLLLLLLPLLLLALWVIHWPPMLLILLL